MKHLLTILAISFSLSASAQKELTILHTNDTHSCIFPLAKTLADTAIADRGGYLRRIAAIKQQRQLDPNLLLFDSGDFSQGSPYYSLFKGDVEVSLMNHMRYDAATIGNHEFDFGIDNMARIFRMAKFPIVCANYDFTGTVLEGIVKPYIVIKRKGIRIGVFGLSPALDGLVDPKNCQGVRFLDPAETAQKMVDILRDKKKCDLVICISHLGWLYDDTGDQNMISKTRGIDLVLGGHSHTYFNNLRYTDNIDGKPIPDDQNGKHAIYVGKMTLSMQKK
ncbi:MAG: metallophosphatase [Prevotella sp.]|nr:metallophosphatase [Prevotella sp.]